MGLFIGRSGHGKSAAAYSFPKPMKVLDLDGRLEGGLVEWNKKEEFDQIDYTYFPPRPHNTTTFAELNNLFQVLDIQCRTNQNKFKTLVVDSLTWVANDLLIDSLPLTHEGGKGLKVGGMNVSGPDDYRFQSSGIVQILSFLRSLPIPNIIVTAHVVNKWGRKKDQNGKVLDPYGPSEIIGEQLALTDKVAETAPTPFDNVFKFEKVDGGSQMNYFVEMEGELTRNTFGAPYGNHNITKVNFYEWLSKKREKEGTK